MFLTADGSFGIVAVRVDALGDDDVESRGHILLWTSPDLVTFHNPGLVQLHKELYVKEAVCDLDGTGEECTHKQTKFINDKGEITMAKNKDSIRISRLGNMYPTESRMFLKAECMCMALMTVLTDTLLLE